jgi:hypothetical protein
MGAGGAAPLREHQQSHAERRVLRAEYRSLHSATLGTQASLRNNDSALRAVLNNAAFNASHLLLAAGKENLILNGGDELRVKLTQLEDLHKKGALLTTTAAHMQLLSCSHSMSLLSWNQLYIKQATHLMPACFLLCPAVARPREHAVDAEVFAQLTECSLNMIKRGQAANKVSCA